MLYITSIILYITSIILYIGDTVIVQESSTFSTRLCYWSETSNTCHSHVFCYSVEDTTEDFDKNTESADAGGQSYSGMICPV